MSEPTQTNSANPLDDFLDESENSIEVLDGFDPFEDTESPPQPEPSPEIPAQSKAADAPAEQLSLGPTAENSSPPKKQEPEQPTDPFAAALAKAQASSEQRMLEAFAAKPPLFSYTTVKEPVTDAEKTFDDLRKQYETDFPELSEKKKVSWTVAYGKVTKVVGKPETDKVHEVKADIEKSRLFLDGIKKAKGDKEREPECLVTPKVTAQSKGETAGSYKGIYPTLEAAMAAPKPIMLIPSRDGKVYEIRENKIGTFITPAANPPELSPISPGFTYHLPKIPYSILEDVVGLFRRYAEQKLEVLAHILYCTETQTYHIHVPKQRVSESSVHADFAEDDSSFYTINGKQYGANIAHTLVQQPEVFYYNRELIAQYDLEDPYALWKSGKWTWSKFASLCKDFITEAGNESSAYSPHFLEMGSAIRGVGFVGFNGNNYVSNVSNKTLVQGIQNMIKMKEDGILSTNSYDLAGFESGKCLFFSDSIINARKTHFNFGSMKTKSILGVVPLPKVDGQSTYYQQFNELEAYGIPAGASNVMAAPYFLRYYLDAANYDKDNFFMDRSALDVYNYCMGQPVRNMFRTGSYIITKDAGIDYYELVIKVFNAKSAQVASILAQNQAVVNASVKQANSKLSKMG